jgi:hypothetical protein
MRFILALGLFGLAAAPAFAQNIDSLRPGHRPLLPRDREIALARSAAPPMVSDSATIWVLGDTAYQVAVHGSNGNVCFVSRDWLDTIEPECFDAEGAATVMQKERLHVELLHRGRSEAFAQQAIADALREGRLRPPSRPALCYMMSPDQWLIDEKREVGGHWHPHLMIYYPYLTSADLGLGGGSAGTARLFGEMTPWSSIVVLLPEFTHPANTAGTSPR